MELNKWLPLIAILTMVLCNGHLEEADAAVQLTLKPKISNLPQEKVQWKATKCQNYYYCDLLQHHDITQQWQHRRVGG